MDALNRRELEALLKAQQALCVSIYLPTERVGVAVEQNPIRLKNLLKQAEERLAAEILRPAEARAFLEPAAALVDDVAFWRRQGQGLAVFLTDGHLRTYRLPLAFEPQVATGARFHIKPLLALFAREGRFGLLALSYKDLRLYEVTRERMAEQLLEGVPLSLAEAMQYSETERHVMSHPAGGPGAGRGNMFHGHGQREDVEKAELERWFRHVDNVVRSRLAPDDPPLLLAGVASLVGIYREANRYAHLVEPYVAGSPDEFSEDELHARAWGVMEPHFRTGQEAAAARFHDLQGTGRAANDLHAVIEAAAHGRVETLFVGRGEVVWGSYDPPSGQILVHGTAQPGDQDLVDLAAVETLLHDGMVHTVSPEQVPATTVRTPVAAVLRY